MDKMINNANYNSFARLTDIASTSNGIDRLLEMVCDLCTSPRASIFEFKNNATAFSTTYQYSKNPELTQYEYLKDEPIEQIEWFFEYFNQTKPVYTPDIEEIKLAHPATYSILKSQKIESMLAVPMVIDNTLIGFLSVDNPKSEINDKILALMHMYTTFVARSILILGLSKETEFFKTHDPLTLALNRRAFELRLEKINQKQSLGIVFCDISELKKINKLQGYKAGNKLLYKLSEALIHIFHNDPVYRTGSDEFVVLCSDISQYDFDYSVSVLKRYISQSKHHAAVGVAYKSTHTAVNIMDLLALAEKDMCKDKANYYCNIDPSSGYSRERRNRASTDTNKVPNKPESDNAFLNITFANNSMLKHFVSNNHFDMDTFITSMSTANHYPYFGDIQNNTFYISEPIQKIIGMNNPIIKNLIAAWENFIPYKDELTMFKNDINDIMTNKKKYHDLKYKVRDLDGNEFWVHCFGIIKWDETKTKPLFFSGVVSKLTHSFTIDPVTSLPKEQMATIKIREYYKKNQKPAYIGFKINSFEEINELRGRSIANSLLKDIANMIIQQYESRIDLYRLDGLRFMVIVSPDYTEQSSEIGIGIKNIIKKIYTKYNIAVRFPCVMGIIDEVNYNIDESDVISNVISLIEVAKSSPETDIVYYTQMVQNHKNKNLMMMALSNDVADGFKNFYTLIQPTVSAKTQKIVSGELLLRWKYEGETISPVTFIPMLEQQGLIGSVGKWVFEQAVCHCKRILTLKPDFYLNFNISYHQILDTGLIDFMKQTLEQWELSPDRLVAELTETHYNDHPIQLSEFINACRNIHMRVALDDFGVGYSSLDLLLQYHSDVVKLDRSLVQRMSVSEKSNDFITSIVYACHKFGKTVCVEGVETKEEVKMVTEAGCDVIQGYYFYKPMEVMQVYELLSNENKNE